MNAKVQRSSGPQPEREQLSRKEMRKMNLKRHPASRSQATIVSVVLFLACKALSIGCMSIARIWAEREFWLLLMTEVDEEVGLVTDLSFSVVLSD